MFIQYTHPLPQQAATHRRTHGHTYMYIGGAGVYGVVVRISCYVSSGLSKNYWVIIRMNDNKYSSFRSLHSLKYGYSIVKIALRLYKTHF